MLIKNTKSVAFRKVFLMEGNKREKNLLLNSILYFFGSLGKGIASILVVFIGSFYIDPPEMGIYDLVVSTIALLQPIIIFQINDGIYRWLLDDSIDKNDTIRTGYRIIFRNIVIANILILIFLPLLEVKYKIFIFVLINVNCFYPVFQQITRGYKNHKIFAISGIINAVLVLGLSWLLLAYSKMGIGGFYLSQIIANAVTIIYLIISQHLPIDFWNNMNSKKYSSIGKPMQKYSILLVPNSINQWIMKALDKYCILFFLSKYFNGIYTVAHRFPDVVIMLNNMFYSAWVEQSIVEYESDDRDAYFSKIFNMYSSFLISSILLIMPLTKYVLCFVSGEKYYDAYMYVPCLYISVIFNGLSSFIGTGYLGTKKTEGIMWTSLSGALINTIINVFFMKKFGLQIAGISSIFAYLSMFIARVIQTKKFFTIKIDYRKFIPLIAIAFFYAFIIQFNNVFYDIIMVVFAIFLFILLNWKIIKNILVTVFIKLHL